MIKRFLFALLLSTICAPALAEYPWDSVCKVSVALRANAYNGGSGTLIAVDETSALVLTVKHVAERVGLPTVCNWNGVRCEGTVLAVSPNADLALLRVKRPAGVRPVPVAAAAPDTGPFVMAGYPGYDREHLRWQQGTYVDHDSITLVVTCRPEPGMSGGATFNRYGQVVGAVSAYGPANGYAGDGSALRALVAPYLK